MPASSVELRGGRREERPRATGRWSILVALVLLPSCWRYPAPTDPAPAPTPYRAMAAWLEIGLPAAGPDAAPSSPALRLAVPRTGEPVADSSLVDGRREDGVALGWDAALALLVPRAEPVILLIDAATSAEELDAVCLRTAALGDRRLRAVAPDGDGDARFAPICRS
jgi:hypothetical protein